MGSKVNFIELKEYEDKLINAADAKYILLSYFIGDYRSSGDLPGIIKKLKLVSSGEKTFDEIHDPDGYWSFGAGAGYFECDKDLAYFESTNPDNEPSMQMPLKEVIALLEEWKTFLGI